MPVLFCPFYGVIPLLILMCRPRRRTPTRPAEMHQTKKGNQWYFGMKGHFGVESRSKLIQRWWRPAQRWRQHSAARLCRERNPRVGRPSVSRPAGRGPPARAQGAGLRQPPLSPSRRRGRGRAGRKTGPSRCAAMGAISRSQPRWLRTLQAYINSGTAAPTLPLLLQFQWQASSLASVHPETLSFWNHWANSDFWGEGPGGFG
jgi:hypothetical protein